MIKGFLFDLDGTLVDTHRANFEAYKAALAEHGVDIGWGDFKQTIGMQSGQFLPLLVPGLPDQTYADIRHQKAEHYKNMLHLTRKNSTLVAFLKSMAAHYKTGLVTTAQRPSAEMILQHHGIGRYFDSIVTAHDVKRHKPDPEGYRKALTDLQLQGSEALAFEDSASGAQAAQAAGLQVVLVKDFVR